MKRRRRRRRKEKHEEREKSLKTNSFKRRSEKIGDTRFVYKRDVNHKKISKTFSKIKSFFLVNRRKMKLEMQKATKKVQKKEKKSKTLVLRKKEKWIKKRHVFFL